jgi:hypothetical protein
MKRLIAAAAVVVMVATPALAQKPCEELKSEIDAKLKAKGVKTYTLEIVPAAATKDLKDGKVVGSCEGGTKKIVYTKPAPAK